MGKLINTFRLVKDASDRISSELFKINKLDIKSTNTTFLKNRRVVSIDTTPTYYDVYKFDGTTYATGATSPTPESAYIKEPITGGTYSYTFRYPIYDFAVPFGETPESNTDGATPWTFQTTIAIVKQSYVFPAMPDSAIDGANFVSYLYNQDDSPVQDLEFILRELGQNQDEIVVDFGEFYRWVNLNNEENEGYRFEYYAIYPVPENLHTFINASLIFVNPQKFYNWNKIRIEQEDSPVTDVVIGGYG